MARRAKKRNLYTTSGPEVIKKSYSTQLSTKFILLIKSKMPIIVGILTFICMINTTSKRLKSRNFFYCRHFSSYEQLKFRAPCSFDCPQMIPLSITKISPVLRIHTILSLLFKLCRCFYIVKIRVFLSILIFFGH